MDLTINPTYYGIYHRFIRILTFAADRTAGVFVYIILTNRVSFLQSLYGMWIGLLFAAICGVLQIDVFMS